MRNPTEMMQHILKSPTAQEIVDYVSQVYGYSYVGLWIFEAIGRALDDLVGVSDGFGDEANPVTATWALDYFEKAYGVQKDPTLTIEQRRWNLLSLLTSMTAYNPARICESISNLLGGIEVEMVENLSKNRFRIVIRDYVKDLSAVRVLLDKIKQAHMIYEIVVSELVESTTNVKIAVAMTRSDEFTVYVEQGE